MISLVRRLLFGLVAIFFSMTASGNAFAEDFLQPEQAYRITAALRSDGSIGLHWDIANGYRLYRGSLSVEAQGGGGVVAPPMLPKGLPHVDPSSGEKSEVYHGKLDVVVPVTRSTAPFRIRVSYQGCADAGL